MYSPYLSAIYVFMLTLLFLNIPGPTEILMCGVAQYVNLWGTLVGYNITANTSMM